MSGMATRPAVNGTPVMTVPQFPLPLAPAGPVSQWPLPAELPPTAPPAPPAAAPDPAGPGQVATWTTAGLAVLIVLGWLVLAPVFFAEMWHTVTTLLDKPMGAKWAWTVPAASELSFTLLFLAAVLLELLRRPSKHLWLAPYPFMAASLALNIIGGNGVIAAALGHATVSGAFFIPMAVAKTVLRRLILTPAERRKAAALADARAHAHDILRAAFGFRWWKVPALVRRQIRTGRLPAAVLKAIDTGAETGDTMAWEPVVRQWIAEAVALPDMVAKSLRAARDAASRSDSADAPGVSAEVTSGDSPESSDDSARGATRADSSAGTPGDSSGVNSARHSGATSRKPRKGSRGAISDEQIAALIEPLLDAGEVTKYQVIKTVKEHQGNGTSIGDARAERVLKAARAKKNPAAGPGVRRKR